MKIILYNKNNNKINLPYRNSFKNRIKHINRKVFKYHRKYFEDNWLGAKKVNCPNPIENVKKVMDIITGYLLGSKEFSTKGSINKYLTLKKKGIKEKLTQDEQLELNNLKDNIIYENRDIVFMVNKRIEQRFAKSISHYIRFKNNSYNPNIYDYKNTIEKISKKLENCSDFKQKVIENKQNLSNLHKKRKELNNIIKEEYKLFQDTNDKNSIDSIVRLANEINNINSDIEDCKYQIAIAYDDYLLDTELYYKTK